MTGIRKRTEDALFLWDSGRRDGAFLIALVAVAAVSRLRYPKLSDRNAFETFLRDSHSVKITGIEFRGKSEPIEHIFYKWLRCQLVHEGSLPPDIQFMEDSDPHWMSVRAGGAPEYVLKIGHGWFHHLIGSVRAAPEYHAAIMAKPYD